MKPTLELLATEWRIAKEQEREAVTRRRQIEDAIRELTGVEEASERTHVFPLAGGEALKVTTRLDRKVDAGLVRMIADEKGLGSEAEKLFRWKAEVNLMPWRQAPAEIVSAFAPAITTKPARPTFEWGTKGEKQ